MKNLLSVITVCLIIQSCGGEKPQVENHQYLFKGNALTSDEVQEKLSLLEEFMAEEPLDSLAVDYRIPRNQGSYLTPGQAKIKLRKGKKLATALNQPYGFGFGLVKLKEFIGRLESLNKNLSNGKDSVTAIRVYFSYSPHPKIKNDSIWDVFMMPVQKNGKNFYAIGDVADSIVYLDPPPIFNTSSPCPTYCD